MICWLTQCFLKGAIRNLFSVTERAVKKSISSILVIKSEH